MTQFNALLERLFPAGSVSTMTGAGGKSTLMRAAAGALAARGIRACMTTTTRVGVEEFAGFPVVIARNAEQMQEACSGAHAACLIVSAQIAGQGKYKGAEPSVFDSVHVSADAVVLVEGDGSRRRPLKAPEPWEPVVPAASRSVVALMGASGFGERITEEHCYNHAAALRILARDAGIFDAAALALLANHPDGCRKGVAQGMDFHVLLNQGDLEQKRSIASATFAILAKAPHARVSLVSFQKEIVYETTEL